MTLTKEQLDQLRRRFRLSPRELQVLELLFEGLPTNREIADRLGTTENAIKAAVRTMFLKTGTRSKHELAIKALYLLQDDMIRRAMRGFEHS
jgi:DNA-binding NarL/FixJ family response regulator